jgi:cytochrome c-type biogenesis protein CcmH/NrfG
MAVRVRRASVLALALSAASLLTACTSTRPPNRILSDAQHSATYQKWDDAAKDYEEYLVRRPENDKAHFELAQVYMAMSRFNDARSHFLIASDVQPLNDQYIDGLAAAMAGMGRREELMGLLTRRAQDSGKVHDFIRMGRYAGKVGNVDDAMHAYLTASRLDGGKSANLQKEIARFYGGIGDKPSQVQRLRMAYWINPADPELLDQIRASGEVPGPTFGIEPR